MSKHKRVELGAVVLLAGVVTALAGCGSAGASHAAGGAPPSSASQAQSPSATHHAAKHRHAAKPPVATVRAYFAAINNQDYARAWHLGGRYTGITSYSSFVTGFQGTAHDTVKILSVAGRVVTARLAARQTDGSVRRYQGTYRVTNGVITRFHVAQVGDSSSSGSGGSSGSGSSGSSGGCYPTASSGNCYEPGEFCPHADAGMHGMAGDGEAIVCENNNGLRWEPA